MPPSYATLGAKELVMYTPDPINHWLRATGGGGRGSLISCILDSGSRRKPSGKEMHLKVGSVCTKIVRERDI